MPKHFTPEALRLGAKQRALTVVRHRRLSRTRGMHQRGRDILARQLKGLAKAERRAAHEDFNPAPYRYDTTNYPTPHPTLCLRFAA